MTSRSAFCFIIDWQTLSCSRKCYFLVYPILLIYGKISVYNTSEVSAMMGKRGRMNKFIVFLLILSIIVGLNLEQDVYALEDGDYTYILNLDDTATITAYSGSDTELVIPDQLGGKNVTVIESDVFQSMGLTSVILPSSLVTINDSAFSTNDLTSIVLPNSVTSVGIYAFYRNKLTTVTLSDHMTVISEASFRYNEIESIVIPEGVTSIEETAFYGNQLTHLTLPESLQTIKNGAFRDNLLSHVTIPNGVTTVESSAFHTNNLESVVIPNSLSRIERFAFNNNQLTSLTIPSTIDFVGAYSFSNSSLTELTIPASVTTIEEYAFSGNKLATLVIPDTVTRIDNNAFMDNKLTSLTLSSGLTTISPLCFQGNELKEVNIPEGIVSIGGSAFKYNLIEKVSLPTSMRIIGNNAFRYNKLKTFYIPEGPTDIDQNALSDNEISKITVADSVTTIAQWAFSNNQVDVGDLIIKGSDGSTAKTHAESRGYTFLDRTMDADLDDLSVVGVSMNEAFAYNQNSYTASVENSISSIKVQPTANVDADKIRVNGLEVLSGGQSDDIDLGVGETVIEVEVTAADTVTTKTYSIMMTRATPVVESSPKPSTSKPTVIKSIISDDVFDLYEESDKAFVTRLEDVEFRIPAGALDLESLKQSMKIDPESSNKTQVEVVVDQLRSSKVNRIFYSVDGAAASVVFAPVDFSVMVNFYGPNGIKERVEYQNFDSYTEKIIRLPIGVDVDQSMTGIVFAADGTFSHVPTKITFSKGRWYANIKSLTNSTYAIVSNDHVYNIDQDHWAKASVEELLSRFIVDTVDASVLDREITRSEFTAYMTKAIGVYHSEVEFDGRFTDVLDDSDHMNAILQANEYGMIKGYDDGTFRGDQFITREEAMAIYARAMKLIKLELDENSHSDEPEDQQDMSAWATEEIAYVRTANIFDLMETNYVRPKSYLTFAEAAYAIHRLLIEADLIN